MRPVADRPSDRVTAAALRSWCLAVRRGFCDALRPAAREDLAWAALGVLGIFALFWAAQTVGALHRTSEPDWTAAIRFGSQQAMALAAFTIWAVAAPCVILPRLALGEASDRDIAPVARHGLTAGRILALQLPALAFGVTALGFRATLAQIRDPLVSGVGLTLAAAAVATVVGECRLWDFARRFLLRTAGVLLLAAFYLGGWQFRPALSALVILTCARLMAGLRDAGGSADRAERGSRTAPAGGATPAAAEGSDLPFPGQEWGEGSFQEGVIPQVPRGLEPGTGIRAALAWAYRGPMRFALLAMLPLLAVMAVSAPAVPWIQRVPGGSLLASFAGYPPVGRNPFSLNWDWQWTQSSSFALLAAVVAWTVLAGRLVVAPLAARATIELRDSGGRGTALWSGLSPFEALAWASLPPALPVALLGLLAASCAAWPAVHDGTPTSLVAWTLLAGPAQACFSALIGVVAGLRAQTARDAARAALAAACLGLPAALVLLNWVLRWSTRSLDQANRFVHSISSGYQGAVVLSLVLAAEAAWWLIRRMRANPQKDAVPAVRLAWWASLAVVLAMAWRLYGTHPAIRANASAEAFAAGQYRLAARILRQMVPSELPRQSTRSLDETLYQFRQQRESGGRGWTPSPDEWVPYESEFPTSADCVRPALAAAEYSAGRPDRARKVMNAASTRAAGFGWPQNAQSMPRVEVYRYLLGVSRRVDRTGSQVRSLDALIAREAVRAAPSSVEDRLAYARAIQQSFQDALLPSAQSVFEEVLKLDPRNKDALLACGRVAEAYRFYPNDPDVLRGLLQTQGSAAGREKLLQTVVRLDPRRSYFESQSLVRHAIADRDFPKALRYLEALLSYPRGSSDSYYWKKRGWIMAETGRLREALACYAHADPGDDAWGGGSLTDYMGLAYLQTRDIRHARDEFSSPYQGGEALLEDLFAAWCSDKVTPPSKGGAGELAHCLAEGGRIRSWQLQAVGEHDDDFTGQAERILKEYPDCLPAAILLAGAIRDHRDRVDPAVVERRIRETLKPFAGRFPKEVANLQARLLSFPGSSSRLSSVGPAGLTSSE